MSLTPGTRLGSYDIVSVVGRGGMGEVYRAHDARLGRDVAIKVLPKELAADPDRVRRYEHGARAIAAPRQGARLRPGESHDRGAGRHADDRRHRRRHGRVHVPGAGARQTLDARSDVFSLGAVLYEMLSGTRAFGGDTAAEVLSGVLRDDPAGEDAEPARLTFAVASDNNLRFSISAIRAFVRRSA